MARQKTKICMYCYSPFHGRRDAKTCSDRCRKGLQRARVLFERDLELKLDDKPGLARSMDRYDRHDAGLHRTRLIRRAVQ